MNNLTVCFGGMSLMVSGSDRSEALLIDTTDSAHKHGHVIQIPGSDDIEVDKSIIWLEENGVRLSGHLMDTATLLARLGDLAPQNGLHSTLISPDPTTTLGWLKRITVWFRLPGGQLETPATGGPGGGALWEFPRFGGQTAKKRQLTEFASLTKANVVGAVRLAILRLGNAEPSYHDVPRNGSGDYVIGVLTQYAGTLHSPPLPGTRVELSELQLVYNCLEFGVGPIPFVRSWPLAASADPATGQSTDVQRNSVVSHQASGGIRMFLLTDPATGICPIAIVTV